MIRSSVPRWQKSIDGDYQLYAQWERAAEQSTVITFRGPLKSWAFADGTTHFMSVPQALSGEIKAHAMLVRRGFGSVKVEVTLDDVTWRTSVFPSKNGGYFLPVKIDVLRRIGLVAGDELTVELELL
jgi:hypothetical protein